MKWGHCQHCGGYRFLRPRRLCHDCYYRPGVREKYPARMNGTGRARAYGLGLSAPAKPTTAAFSSERRSTNDDRITRTDLE